MSNEKPQEQRNGFQSGLHEGQIRQLLDDVHEIKEDLRDWRASHEKRISHLEHWRSALAGAWAIIVMIVWGYKK